MKKTKLNLKRITMLLMGMFFCSATHAQTFTENGGTLTIQAEDLNLKTNWKKQSSVAGYTGSGYIVWEGAEYFNSPGPNANMLSATVRINTPGKYRFIWRSKVGKGNDSKEHNDTWLKFPNADDFYGERDGTKKWPNGSGKSPNPDGKSADGFLKVFLNRTTDWTETTVTSDFEDYPVYVEFDKVGDYTIQISPRSDFHLIDQIQMTREGSVVVPPTGGAIKDIKGRVAYSADGDEHDTDDWLASPWSLALLRASGQDDKLVFFEYNNHVWGTTANYDEIQDNNIKGLISRWGGFPNASFYNVETQETAAKNKLVQVINASSSTDPLWLIAAGPIETIGRAVDAAQSNKLQYVTIISHSDWNNDHANRHHGSKYTINYLTSKGCKYKKVEDMNGDSNDGYTEFGLKRKTAVMENRLKNHADERIKWLWTARKMPEYERPSYQVGYYDYSDAGMTWWLITGGNNGGDEGVTPKKTMDLLESFINGVTPTCQTTLNGLTDFTDLTINGLAPTYKDNDRGAIAVNSIDYPTQWAGATTTFTGTSGTYDITLTTLTEIDGESSYRLRVGGTLVGTYKNPKSNTDYAPSTKTWTGVSVNNGDVIQVECQAHTNGEIPEGGGTAYARGRWTKVDLKCGSTGGTNNKPTASFTQPIITSLEEGYSELYVLVEATDPDGDEISTMLKIDGVEIRAENGAPYEWGHATSPNPGETLNLSAGDHLFEVVVTDAKSASTTIKKTITITEKGIVSLSPIHDAYVEGTAGKNDEVLRLESGKRATYLQFDLSSIGNQSIVTANLILTVGDDFGAGTINVFNSSNVSWTEGAINASNSPTKGSLVTTKSGTYATGSTQTFDVANMSISNNKVTFVLESDGTGADDVSFASKENGTYAKPVLRLKIDSVTGFKSSSDENSLLVYPNPSETGVYHLSQSLPYQVYNVTGSLVLSQQSETIDLSNHPSGVYFLKVEDKLVKLIK